MGTIVGTIDGEEEEETSLTNNADAETDETTGQNEVTDDTNRTCNNIDDTIDDDNTKEDEEEDVMVSYFSYYLIIHVEAVSFSREAPAARHKIKHQILNFFLSQTTKYCNTAIILIIGTSS